MAGFAVLSTGLVLPKKPPTRVLEPADVPVAAGVVPPVAPAFPALGNKLPPAVLFPLAAVVVLPGPGPKRPPPEVAGFEKPNRPPVNDRNCPFPKLNHGLGRGIPPADAVFVPAVLVLPNRLDPVVIPEVPGFELVFENSPPPVAGPVVPVVVAGLAK